MFVVPRTERLYAWKLAAGKKSEEVRFSIQFFVVTMRSNAAAVESKASEEPWKGGKELVHIKHVYIGGGSMSIVIYSPFTPQ